MTPLQAAGPRPRGDGGSRAGARSGSGLLTEARRHFDDRSWMAAYETFRLANDESPLRAEDLELLANAAYLIGKEDEYLLGLKRAHHMYLQAGQTDRAVRCAFWMGLRFSLRRKPGSATGWFNRAHRLLENAETDSLEHGYLLLPTMLQRMSVGECDAAVQAGKRAVAISRRFGDRDLFALAIHEQGHALLEQGRVEEGLSLLDEAMVAVLAGELSPMVTGLIYCSVIGYCQKVYAIERTQEWTDALSKWWDRQPDLMAFTGVCLIHRAEILQMAGSWAAAIEEARRASHRFEAIREKIGAGQAIYRVAEVHRLKGEFQEAENAYRQASKLGWDPQPGWALMRLAQGDSASAAGAIRRVSSEKTGRMRRSRLLPAYVEIMLAVGEVEEARRAYLELEAIADGNDSEMLRALVAEAKARIYLTEGHDKAALDELRHAAKVWRDLDAPYQSARVRELLGTACRRLGDEDTALLELEAARTIYRNLEAAPDLDRLASGSVDTSPDGIGSLTTRELEVLRLIAAGDTNKTMASKLSLSVRTVDRHVSNIYNKLGVSSRAAATAHAYEKGLI